MDAWYHSEGQEKKMMTFAMPLESVALQTRYMSQD